MKDNVIGLGKPKKLSKSPWEYKVKKGAKETQGRQMGLKEPRKRKTNKPWAVYDVEIENGPQQVQSNESKENKGLMSSPWAPRMKDNVIGPGKPKELTKSPWECKVKKRAKEAEGKQMGQGQGRLKENK